MKEPRLDMIIRSLRQYWPAHMMEWLMVGVMTSWGLYVLLTPSVFTDPRTAELFVGLVTLSAPITDHPSMFWGGVAFLTGILRGALTRTPVVRLVGAFVSMFLVTWICIGFWYSGVPYPGIVVYSWLVIADLISTYRAAVDVVYVEKQRHDQREARRVVDFPSRIAA